MMPIEVENVSLIEETLAVDGSSTLDSSPSKRKGGKKKSDVWKHFERVEDNKKAKCRYCTQQLSFGPISNLIRHLRKKHPSIAATLRYQNSNTVVLETRIVDQPGEADETKYDCNRVQYRVDEAKRMKLQALDVESLFKKEHSYVERRNSSNNNINNNNNYNNNSKFHGDEGVFGQFIESELGKFQSELRRRQCKRELIKVLMHHQEMEDKLYSPTDSLNCSLLRENGSSSPPRAEVFYLPQEQTSLGREQHDCDTACLTRD